MAYFIQLKIRKACELLDQTDSTIREIASQLGYDDPYYFSRIFKKDTGLLPRRLPAIRQRIIQYTKGKHFE